MTDVKTIVLNTPAEELERILSPFIEEQFPAFVRSDYRKLILFVKAYYEWMEKEGNVGFSTSRLDTVFDVDQNLEEFYSYFKKTFLQNFPEVFSTNTEGVSVNKKTLLKKIKQFYGNKGTESAYRFLFRLLFDSNVQFYYPKVDVLRASGGNWIEKISVKITRNNETQHRLIEGGTIQQYSDVYTLSGYATIDRAVQYYQDGVPVTELYLTNLVGTFLPNSDVVIIPPDQINQTSFIETTFSVLGDFYIQTPGQNYKIGDVVYLTDTKGTGFSAKVQQTGLDGCVKRIQIENSGINYPSTVTALVISSNGTNSDSKIVFYPSAITRYPGYYKGNEGKLSSTPKIYDGEYYQDFSYELKTSVSIDKYYSILKDIVHPSGTKMFGSILLESNLMCRHIASSQLTRIGIPVLGNYLPYTFGTTLDLRNNGITSSGSWKVNYWGTTLGTTGDLYPAGYNPYITGTADVGPTGKTAPAGTTFFAGGFGGKLGFTYCLVPEGGRTAHDPLGAPMGGITAWLLGNESKLTPDVVGYSPFGLVGLTLWLKPENIGVCGGSLITGRCMDIWRDASLSQNHAVPPKWDYWTNSPSYSGVTIDKLRPTLVVNDRGVLGRTGIRFNGGVIYGPHTVWAQAGICGGYLSGKTLGSMGTVSFGTGTVGEKLLSGTHFVLTRGISLSKDMTIIIVFRSGSTAGGYTSSNYGLGMVSSSNKLKNFYPATGSGLTFGGTEIDHLLYHRSYSDVDNDSTKQNSVYYFVNTGNNQSLYPYETGLVGIRSNTGSTSAHRIAFNPYTPDTSGVSLEHVSLGEWRRNPDTRIQSFYNGSESKNYSYQTARRIARPDSPGGSSPLNFPASEVSYNGNTFDIGRFGAFCLPVVDSPYSDSSSINNFITAALGNVSYSFNGVIYEVLVYDRVLDQSERLLVYSYLSKKYRLDQILAQFFEGVGFGCYPAAVAAGYPYWYVSNHPSKSGSRKIVEGISMGNIVIQDMLSLSGVLYKSAGTKLANGTVLTQDTYDNLGE
ncbi:MAG: hypothetical protein EB127_06125 [Alphaproteobacteria bacterium]|nr:hypothetical protein [Alphaproteobacteria bacterium]